MAVDQKVSKYTREHGPARDWYLAAEGAGRAFEALRAAIESEGYEVLHDISDDTYSVRPRERCATEGCAGHATQRYEHGGVGSLYCAGCIAKIVAQAEREACAKIVAGRVHREHYREWPEYGPGNRSKDSDMVKLCDALAGAIRARNKS